MFEFDNPDLEHLIGNAWYDTYKYHFRHHPDKDEIVRQLIQEDLPQELVDLYFAEAEYYTFEQRFNEDYPNDAVEGVVTIQSL